MAPYPEQSNPHGGKKRQNAASLNPPKETLFYLLCFLSQAVRNLAGKMPLENLCEIIGFKIGISFMKPFVILGLSLVLFSFLESFKFTKVIMKFSSQVKQHKHK